MEIVGWRPQELDVISGGGDVIPSDVLEALGFLCFGGGTLNTRGQLRLRGTVDRWVGNKRGAGRMITDLSAVILSSRAIRSGYDPLADETGREGQGFTRRPR